VIDVVNMIQTTNEVFTAITDAEKAAASLGVLCLAIPIFGELCDIGIIVGEGGVLILQWVGLSFAKWVVSNDLCSLAHLCA